MLNKEKEFCGRVDQGAFESLFDPIKKKETIKKYAADIDRVDLPKGMRPLNDMEKSEFLEVVTNLVYDMHPSKDIYEVADRFGERIVPYILNSPLIFDAVLMMKILDKLVTEKTAGEVLKALNSHKLEIWSGALAAAKGKERTAPGLADILKNWRFSENTLRSNHIELIKAIGETKCDDVSDALADFYKKLSKDKNYNKKAKENFKKTGINWLEDDAREIVKSLTKIGGPKARVILGKMSKAGNKYIKKAIENN